MPDVTIAEVRCFNSTFPRPWSFGGTSLILMALPGLGLPGVTADLRCTFSLLASCRLGPFWRAPSQPAGSWPQSPPQCPGAPAPASCKLSPARAYLTLEGLALGNIWEMPATRRRTWALEKGTWVQILPLVTADSETWGQFWTSGSFLSMSVSWGSNKNLL